MAAYVLPWLALRLRLQLAKLYVAVRGNNDGPLSFAARSTTSWFSARRWEPGPPGRGVPAGCDEWPRRTAPVPRL